MSFTNIISAIGNTSSVYPLILRDCGVEIPSKVYLTYQENKEDKNVAFLATREKIIDEYLTSAVWLGGIPLVEWVINEFLIKKKGFNPNVNLKLFKESDCQGIDYNVKYFKERLEKGNLSEKLSKEITTAIEDLKKVKSNKSVYEKLLSVKFAAATAIPIALMGFVIPKMVFGLTAKTKAAQKAQKDKQKLQEQQNSLKNNIPFTALNKDVFSKMSLTNSSKVAFGGNLSSSVANFTTYQKMAAIDGGYALGRVATSRKKNEAARENRKKLLAMFADSSVISLVLLAFGQKKATPESTIARDELVRRFGGMKSYVWPEDSENVRTSQGVKLPVATSRRMLALWKAGRVTVGQHVGPYTVREIGPEFVQIGCHCIPVENLRELDKALNS